MPRHMFGQPGHVVPRVMDDSSYERLSTERCDAIEFRALCERFEKVQKCSQPRQRLGLLFTSSLQTYLHVAGQSVYPLMRLVLPRIDRERGSFGVQIKSLIKLYIAAVQLGDRSAAANQLRDWKLPGSGGTGGGGVKVTAGDFPSTLEAVLENRAGGQKRLTLGDVNARLDALCRLTNEEQRRTWLRQLLDDCTAREHKWIVRIILKEMKIGLNEEKVLGFYHPDASDMYNTCTDLRKVLDTLTDVNVRVVQQVALGTPFAPMLAKRMRVFTVKGAMGGAAFVMEPKLDGERIVCHKNGQNIQLFTRNGNDYSANYGENLRRYILDNVRAAQCILDGEVLSWDDRAKKFVSFGTNRTVAAAQQQHEGGRRRSAGGRGGGGGGSGGGADNDDADANDAEHGGPGVGGAASDGSKHSWIVYVVFDIMYVKGAHAGVQLESDEDRGSDAGGRRLADDEKLMTRPLEYRHRVLRAVLKPVPKRLEIIEQTVVPAGDGSPESVRARHKAVMRFLDAVMLENLEGVLLKDMGSACMPGSRDGSWVKLKPDYIDEMGKTLDLLVLAGYYGHGSRGGALSNFLLGVAEKPLTKDTPAADVQFRSFCKVGTGYTRVELGTLEEALMVHAKRYDKTSARTRPPHFRDWKPSKEDDVPDVWFPPHHSKILELKGYDVTPTDQFSANVTLRFPRVAKIRYDKEWHECETLQTVQALGFSPKTLNQAVKAADITVEQLEKPRLKRPRMGGKGGKKAGKGKGGPSVQQEFRIVDLAGVRQTSKVFRGYGFYVVPGKDYEPGNGKDVLQKKLFQGGGTLLANPGDLLERLKAHYVIAASNKSQKVQNLVRMGHQDIYAPAWVDFCLARGRLVPPTPSMIIYATPATQESLRQFVDCFGDSFVDPIEDTAAMKQLFKAMDRNPLYDPLERADITEELRACDTEVQDEIDLYEPFALHRFVVYADMYAEVQCPPPPAPVLDSQSTAGSDGAGGDSDSTITLLSSQSSLRSTSSFASFASFASPAARKRRSAAAAAAKRRQEERQPLDPDTGFALRGLSLQLRLFGATISPKLGPRVTHVLVDPTNLKRKDELKAQLLALREDQYRASNGGGSHDDNDDDGNDDVMRNRPHSRNQSVSRRVVSLDWARECIKWHSPHVDPKDYLVSLR